MINFYWKSKETNLNRKNAFMAGIFTSLATLAVADSFEVGSFSLAKKTIRRLQSSAQAQTAPNFTPDEANTISIFQNVSRSVVFINTKVYQQNPFTLNVSEIPKGSGSGFVWDSNGHVVTNFHVVEGANAVTVTLSDRSTYNAKVIGTEPEKDIAILKLAAPVSKLRPVVPGQSEALVVGQKVLAIGNPFGLDQTLTTGIVSALGREIDSAANRKIRNVIQTDAAINPGNSGGPLLDSQGRLIGMNTAIYSPSGASSGIGFAVPVDTIKRVVPELIKFGKVMRPGLGIAILPDAVARRNGVEGVAVARVAPDSGAEAAGLQGITRNAQGEYILGDVIVSVGNRKIKNEDDLLDTFEQFKAGDTVSLSIVREGKRRTVQVKLQKLD
jgi:S1-C subfamily serine protease